MGRLASNRINSRIESVEKCLNQQTSWSKIIFSEEQKFNLDGSKVIHLYL